MRPCWRNGNMHALSVGWVVHGVYTSSSSSYTSSFWSRFSQLRWCLAVAFSKPWQMGLNLQLCCPNSDVHAMSDCDCVLHGVHSVFIKVDAEHTVNPMQNPTELTASSFPHV